VAILPDPQQRAIRVAQLAQQELGAGARDRQVIVATERPSPRRVKSFGVKPPSSTRYS